MCHILRNPPALIYGSFSQRSPSNSVAEWESGLNTVLDFFGFSNQLLCCILKRTSSACALCVAWFLHWLRHDEDNVVCYCKFVYYVHFHTLPKVHLLQTQRICEFLGISCSLSVTEFLINIFKS